MTTGGTVKRAHMVRDMVLAALFLALGLVLPSAFHAIGAGKIFLPMHLPVLLCGFVCGWRYGAAVGFLVPLLASITTGAPPLFPVAAGMMLELAAYGALTGLLHKKCNVYVSLIGAMLGGRIVLGAANALFFGMAGKAYGFAAFAAGAFAEALPGIALQLVLLPLIVLALEKTGLVGAPPRG